MSNIHDRAVKACAMAQSLSDQMTRQSLEAELAIRRMVHQGVIDEAGALSADVRIDQATGCIEQTTLTPADLLLWVAAMRQAAQYMASTEVVEGGPTILQQLERIVP